LEVPYDRKVRPAGTITVYHGPGTGDSPAVWVFKLIDEDGRREPQRRVTVYDFLRDTGGPLVYVPSDQFFAHLPVKKEGDAQGWILTWARSRSEMYQFECLIRPTRLHRANQSNLEGEIVNDIPLIVSPDRGLPRVPDLVPVVKLRKR
jgi:hypothetical protein